MQGDDGFLVSVAVKIKQLQSPGTVASRRETRRRKRSVMRRAGTGADRVRCLQSLVAAAFKNITRHSGDGEQARVGGKQWVGEFVGQPGSSDKAVVSGLERAVRDVVAGGQSGAVGLGHHCVNIIIRRAENAVHSRRAQVVVRRVRHRRGQHVLAEGDGEIRTGI